MRPGPPIPSAGQIDRAIGFGLSQSGRYLHDYLYLGFNADEAGRVVFDGLMPHISGGKKTFTNYRFSQPGRSPYEHADMLYPGADFPFTYPVITDSAHGKARRLPGALPCGRQLPEDHQDRQRARILSAARLPCRDGHARQCAHDARQCQALFAVEPAALFARQRQIRDGEDLRLSDQSPECGPLGAGLAGGAGCLDQQGHVAAEQPLPQPRQRNAGAARDRQGRLPSHPRRRLSEPNCATDRAQIRCDAAVQGRRLSGLRAQDRRRWPRPSLACGCRRWKRRRRPTPAGTCAKPVLAKANYATTTAP